MARTTLDSSPDETVREEQSLILQAAGEDRVELPSASFIADASMTRDGDALILETPAGERAVVEGYFSAEPPPLLHAGDGGVLTPELVASFVRNPSQYAANATASDESPIGAVEEVSGNATVTRADGTVETIAIGTPIYQGDIIETDATGAVNIGFIDETTMAVSGNARLAVDQYTFDPATESGTTNLSVLRGLFVFTSGLIGRDDPDDVKIETPVGSIGIRGTIIAGDIDPSGESNITVLEGAIVVTNGAMETTLSEQFETVRLSSFDQPMQPLGVLPASDIGARFQSIGTVFPSLFTTINDAAQEQTAPQPSAPDMQQPTPEPQARGEAPAPGTSAVSAPETPHAPQPVVNVFDSGIATLNENTAGIPTFATATGQTSASAQVGSPAAPSPAISSGATTAQAAPATTASPPSADTLHTPANPAALAPTERQPVPFAFGMNGGGLTDTALAGAIVGVLGATESASFRFSNGTATSTNGYFQIVQNSTSGAYEVHLTSTGEAKLSESFDVVQLGTLDLQAVPTAGGTSLSQSISAVVRDSHTAAQIINLDMPSSNHVGIIADTLNNNAGYSISALGDVDGDGFDDFIFTNNTASAGQNHAYRVDGGAPLGSSTITNMAGAGRLDILPLATPSNDPSQAVVRGIGDFNGDGVEDYVIGQQANGPNASGTAAVTSGQTAANALQFTNSPTGAQIGYAVDGIGDYNNDGYADVVIGAPGLNSASGGAYFVKGGLSPWTPIDATATGSASHYKIGAAGGGSFGSSVVGLGDFNGDGFSDFAVGSPTHNSDHGSVSLFLGKVTGNPVSQDAVITGNAGQFLGTKIDALGDINGDGKSDLLVTGLGNIAQIYLGGDTASDAALSVPDTNFTLNGGGGIGDFNGDGLDDFVLSFTDSDSTNSYIVFGKESFSGTIDIPYLKNAGNAMELRYNGASASDGWLEIAGIGDVNGDGYDDFAMGVPDINGAASGNGGVAVIHGRDTGRVSSGVSAAGHDGAALVGGTGADTLDDNSKLGVSLRGGAGNDVFSLHNTTFLGIGGGSQGPGGMDTILMNNSLDFSNVNFEKISGIESLRFGGTGATVTLTLENIFNLLKSSDTGSLKIESALGGNSLTLDAPTASGPASDASFVAALNETGSGAAHVSTSGGYSHFKIGGYNLYIDTDLAVNVQ